MSDEDVGSEADAQDDADGNTRDSDADADLTHTTESGDVQMVDVGDKPETARRAVARGEIHLQESTVTAIRDDEVGKGDVLATARVGAVQAVKHTWETIPMCHQIPITNVETAFDVRDDRVVLTVTVETTGQTGCEMEALEGVTTGLNVVWDMVKAAEKREAREGGRDGDAVAASQYPGTAIEGVAVVEKTKRALD
ncbi:cyclic pyranopterin phosphate synthase [Halarchaeum rubridurum]|uniref:Cyclic pyranopterin monophosphate synthase MoaC n=1 Tax=Halarchaeum rubridurum TaxID=489911 RepID=A0A830FYT2_9EURY|nr:cyclic pyranopterin monophosphate synthase MoaC [Halarchaeum rubridurum]MBP1953652.1 cyclic pyranopterin phosphate synthase [Halarchaeum rubridurum]GGM63692.1 cyclic pyranopterin monophosphate synthase MoaC [Halarchaeum rubridurum]